MKLNKLQWEVFSDGVHYASQELEMNLYTMNNGCHNTEPLKYGVNWCAKGTQDPEATLDFARKLQEAAQVAQMLTAMEITYTYEVDGPEVDDELFKKAVKAITDTILLQMPEMIEAILNRFAA